MKSLLYIFFICVLTSCGVAKIPVQNLAEAIKVPFDNNDTLSFVDLGLSVLWANKNIGAVDECDAGNYYTWGGCTTQVWYSSSDYIHYKTPKYLLAYPNAYFKGNIRVDKLSNLQNVDDIANQLSYNIARIPSKEEIEELINNCVWKYIKKKKYKGYCVIGPNGNSIFLPVTGDYELNRLVDGNLFGMYWSNTLSPTKCSSNAYALMFNEENQILKCDPFPRHYGLVVRPVLDK